MAKSNTQTMLALSAILLFSAMAASSPDGQFYNSINPRKAGLRREKLSHLRFFLQDIVSGKNPTAVVVASAPSTKTSPFGFGLVAMMDDPLTVGPDLSSRRIGYAQGIYAGASQTEFGVLMVFNYIFTEGKYNGSTLSVLGREAGLNNVREMPILGGSGLFRYARGYALSKVHFFNVTSNYSITEYNLYVFHY